MAKKVALLIGVSEYGEGIPSLSAPINDVAAMKRVLENPNMGGFDQVEKLENPDPTAMRLAVQRIFANCRKDDLVLLFFSGHGITDDNNRLYLATKGTSKDFYKATSVPASFIHDVSIESYAKRQAIILDCCYSGAFAEGWQAKSVGLDLKRELGGEGRVVLTSSTATQTSFQQEGENLSLYTKYFVEGIETGAADQDEDGKIYARELHEYAQAKVQEQKPKQKPGIIIDREGFNILLSQAPVNDPELDFRKLVEQYATEGQVTAAGKYILRVKRQEFGVTKERSDEIVDEVLAPYRKRLENIELYKEAYKEAVEQHYPLTERLLRELQELQNILGLENNDLEKDQQKILSEKETEYQYQIEIQRQEQEEYKIKLQQYEQEFLKAIELEYPLSQAARNQMNNLAQSLDINTEDRRKIERPIMSTKYKSKQKEQESQKQQQQEAEKAIKLELKQQKEQKEYKNKLQQYKHEFLKVIQAKYPLDQDVRAILKNSQRTLGLTDEEIARIEQPIIDQEKVKYQKQMQEKERQNKRQQNLQTYEQYVIKKIESGYSLDSYYVRDWLNQLQRNLGLMDSDISSIEAKYFSRKHLNPKTSSQSQPGQGEILASKKARRSILLGSTALGLVLFFSGLNTYSISAVLLGISALLIGSVLVWVSTREQREKKALGFGNAWWLGVGIVLMIISSCMLVFDLDYVIFYFDFDEVLILFNIFGVILNLSSSYYRCW